MPPRIIEFLAVSSLGPRFTKINSANYNTLLAFINTCKEAKEAVLRRYKKFDLLSLIRTYPDYQSGWSSEEVLYIDFNRDIPYFYGYMPEYLLKLVKRSPALGELLRGIRNIAFSDTLFAGEHYGIERFGKPGERSHNNNTFNQRPFREWLKLVPNLETIYLVDYGRGTRRTNVPVEFCEDKQAYDAEKLAAFKAEGERHKPDTSCCDPQDFETSQVANWELYSQKFGYRRASKEVEIQLEKHWREKLAQDPGTQNFSRVKLKFVVEKRPRELRNYSYMFRALEMRKLYPYNPARWGLWDWELGLEQRN